MYKLCNTYITCETLCYMYITCETLCYMYITCETLCYMYITCETLCYMYITCETLCYMYITCETLCHMQAITRLWYPLSHLGTLDQSFVSIRSRFLRLCSRLNSVISSSPGSWRLNTKYGTGLSGVIRALSAMTSSPYTSSSVRQIINNVTANKYW